MTAEAAMPILNRQLRNLSPLEEDTAAKDGCAGHKNIGQRNTLSMTSCKVCCNEPTRLPKAEGEGTSLVMDIGSLILTSRGCEPDHAHARDTGRMNRGRPSSMTENELLLAASSETLPLLTTDIQALWAQRLPLCIEVRGQARGVCLEENIPTLLLEQWNIQVLSKRPPSPSPHPSSPQLLVQAVCSYLHFSQIRSWQEVGGKDHAPCPFQLLYRVCAPGESSDDFSPYSASHHTFPPLPLSSHSFLLVSVASLPRLSHLPEQLVSCSPSDMLASGRNAPLSSSATRSDKLLQNSANRWKIRDRSSDVGSGLTSAPMPFCVGRLAKESPKEGFPFSPPLPSPLSPKLLMGLADRSTFDPSSESADKSLSSLEKALQKVHLDSADPTPIPVKVKSSNGRGGGGAVPPAACSPAPFSRMHMNRGRGGAKRRSCAMSCKRISSRVPPQRSNSAPVFVPSLCLLGTFEESVLNGRLEPCGHVEGFMAELGASGSFCPPHVMLPVNAAFYSLHDNHGGTSPYLGQMDLSGVGKRGYQVPRKGTVQVNLFNPNHTVVKMYIVTYDFSDMPPLTQTFLRQKTLSRPTHPSGQGATPTTYLPSLHYLIHLRFLCSKSKRIYLHRDIRLIFARRAPDTDPDDSKVTLYTITEGPLEPKYSPSNTS